LAAQLIIHANVGGNSKIEMRTTIKNILIYLMILATGILIGWWANEMYRFGNAMKNDKAPNIDTVNFIKDKND
jgi:hypothetical protein